MSVNCPATCARVGGKAVRLYLSSFRMGDHPEHLMGLVGGDRRHKVVIANAMDDAPPDVRRAAVDLVDDPDAVPRSYGALPLWDGLAVLDEAFVPHYRSPKRPETAAIELIVARYR